MTPLDDRVSTLELWQESVAPMLRQLAEDQAYRARWQAERARRWSRWQRWAGLVCGAIGATAVFASAVVQLSHLL